MGKKNCGFENEKNSPGIIYWPSRHVGHFVHDPSVPIISFSGHFHDPQLEVDDRIAPSGGISEVHATHVFLSNVGPETARQILPESPQSESVSQ